MSNPKRIIQDVRKITIDPTPDKPTPVLEDKRLVDPTYIKQKFIEFSKTHKEALLNLAISYMAVTSAMDEVVLDLKEVMAQDFSQDDTFKDQVDMAFDRAVAYYLNRHSLSLAKADASDTSMICTALFTTSNPSQQPRITAREIVEALGLTVRQSAPTTDPYASRPRHTEE